MIAPYLPYKKASKRYIINLSSSRYYEYIRLGRKYNIIVSEEDYKF